MQVHQTQTNNDVTEWPSQQGVYQQKLLMMDVLWNGIAMCMINQQHEYSKDDEYDEIEIGLVL